MPLPYAGASDIWKRCLRRRLFFLTALASEPKRSELYKNHSPNETHAFASGPNETDALASVPNKPDAFALLLPIISRFLYFCLDTKVTKSQVFSKAFLGNIVDSDGRPTLQYYH